ncbi:MAG TPA: rhodanese-like domain-containing protein [candidate division Zixibacteria bacterium]|nr:rhodanese-like domain-containing protein [candidate division Zixibacteria bacterium]
MSGALQIRLGLALCLAFALLSQSARAEPGRYPEFAGQPPPASVSFISVEELAEEIHAGKRPLIIDVRTAEEYHEAHILGALSAPLSEFRLYLSSIPRDRLVVLY